MAQVLVRRLDPKVVDSLRRCAAARGRSLEEELRIILTASAHAPHTELLEWLESHSFPAPRGFDAVAAIRQARQSH